MDMLVAARGSVVTQKVQLQRINSKSRSARVAKGEVATTSANALKNEERNFNLNSCKKYACTTKSAEGCRKSAARSQLSPRSAPGPVLRWPQFACRLSSSQCPGFEVV